MNNPIYIKVAKVYYHKSDTIVTGVMAQGGEMFKVIKIYKKTWWKRILNKVGFKLMTQGYKVKIYD